MPTCMRVSCPTPIGFGVAPMYGWVALWCVGTAEFVNGIATKAIRKIAKIMDCMVFFKILTSKDLGERYFV